MNEEEERSEGDKSKTKCKIWIGGDDVWIENDKDKEQNCL